ncbi:Leucine-rich repeat-containing protein 1 [Hondaea fermentalgiana]|uniref:Leucine-rich repeat-containing protein 1 n=1 Tax=Hondaea fermentalgiana TaxID=2315210 RepID=A0A2R5GSS5_9STRA|nr:Leucine-rich repeat-containing protein 1 [Hondaea fermentalgiana]|eukprot:GBG33927.1 Leucine-rich repeat-containing protein 1 [Hondaea fermentalgiana]
MGNGASGAAELLEDTEDPAVLQTLCGKLSDLIEEDPACERWCKPILEKALPDDLDAQAWKARRKALHDAACAFVAIVEAAGGAAPTDTDELVTAQTAVGTTLNLSLADRDSNEVVGALYAFRLPALAELPSPVLALGSKITELSLKKNGLKEIPAAIGTLTGLTSLDLSENALETLPDEICALSALETLDASENCLTALPENLGNLTSLQTFFLFKNALTKLPDSIGGCAQLSELNLFNNKLIKIPATLAEIEALVDLNLGGNKLKTLPSTKRWINLERLALSWNTIVMLNDFGGMPKLRQLQLNRNQLAEIPDDALVGCDDLESVDLSTNRLTALPLSLLQCSGIQTLDATSNELSALADCSALRSLKILKLGSNKLVDITESNLGKCVALETLFLPSNQLAKLPADLTDLVNLSRANVSGNAQTLDRADPETARVVSTLSEQCAQKGGRWIE